MKQEKQIQWFLSELPDLQKSGIISQENAQALETHYKAELDSVSGRMQTMFIRGILLIGVLLIACGIILLTAYNWDMLPRTGKAAVTFIPFLLAGAFGILTIVKGWGKICRESSALLLFAAIATLISLISQIYHLDGSMYDFFTLLLALTLPLVYIFNAVFLANVHALFLFFFSASSNEGGLHSCWLPFAYTILWLPYAGWILKNTSSGLVRNTMRAAVLVAAAGLSIRMNHHQVPLYFAAGSSFFLLAGSISREKTKSFFSGIWLYAGYLIMTIWLLIFSGGKITEFSILKLNSAYFWTAWGIFIAGIISSLVLNGKKEYYIFAAFPLLAFLIFLNSAYTALAFMGYLILAAVVMIDTGFRGKELFLINLGLFQILLLAVVRFFDSFYGILTRSIVFMALGALLIAANWFISRFFKKGATNEKA